MQIVLATTNNFYHEGVTHPITEELFRESLLPWLTEQYDKEERKETVSLIMEAAITLFVFLELFVDAWKHFFPK